MTFMEKIFVGQISGKAMYSGKVIYMAFTENSFKFMQGLFKAQNKNKSNV